MGVIRGFGSGGSLSSRMLGMRVLAQVRVVHRSFSHGLQGCASRGRVEQAAKLYSLHIAHLHIDISQGLCSALCQAILTSTPFATTSLPTQHFCRRVALLACWARVL